MGEMMTRLGCEGEDAGDGEEALAIFSKARKEGRPVAGVILDLKVKGGEQEVAGQQLNCSRPYY